MSHFQTLPKLIARARGFFRDQSGAVTVDWVAITGAVIAMVISFFAYFNGEMGTVTTSLIAMINGKI